MGELLLVALLIAASAAGGWILGRRSRLCQTHGVAGLDLPRPATVPVQQDEQLTAVYRRRIEGLKASDPAAAALLERVQL